MVVQWLRLHAANTGAQDWSLGGKLGSHMPCDVAKKIKKKKQIRKTEDTNDLILYFYFSLNNNRATSPSEWAVYFSKKCSHSPEMKYSKQLLKENIHMRGRKSLFL